MNDARSLEQRLSYPWPFFVAMGATLALFFSFQAIFPTFPLYIATIGGSPADNGLATWVFALAALLMRPPAGILADRWGRKPILVLGSILFGGGPLLYALVPNVPVLLGVRVVHGLGMALFSTAFQAFAADLVPPGRYGEGLGLANVASSVAMMGGPLFGEWMVQAHDFWLSFAVLGAIGGVGVLTTLALPGRRRVRRASVSRSSSSQGSLREVLRRPGVRIGSLWMMLLGMPFGAFIAFLPLLADARGLGGTGLAFAIYAITSALAQPLAGRVADRWEPVKTAMAGLALVGLAMAGLAGVAHRWALMVLIGCLGAGSGMTQAGLGARVQGAVESHLRGSAAAVQFTAFDLLVGFGSWTLGLLAGATGYGVMYAAVGGVVLLGLVVGGLLMRRRWGDGKGRD